MAGKRTYQPTRGELRRLYPRHTIEEIAKLHRVGPTVVLKRLREYGIPAAKHHRRPRSPEHSVKIAVALTGRSGPRRGRVVKCRQCDREFYVPPGRIKSAKFCSNACRGQWRSENWIGNKHPAWTGGRRVKTCQGCGTIFRPRVGQPITTFRLQKFCSKTCADAHGVRLKGSENNKWKGGIDRRERRTADAGASHKKWLNAVLKRDGFQCKRCGQHGSVIELHVHHVRPVEFFPEVIGSVENGITLCAPCHWQVHTDLDPRFIVSPAEISRRDYRARSTFTPLGDGVAFGIKEGRMTRRWYGRCHWCGEAISKRLSDVTGKEHVFCGRHCAIKHVRAFKHPRRSRTVIPDTAVRPAVVGVKHDEQGEPRLTKTAADPPSTAVAQFPRSTGKVAASPVQGGLSLRPPPWTSR